MKKLEHLFKNKLILLGAVSMAGLKNYLIPSWKELKPSLPEEIDTGMIKTKYRNN